MSRRPSAPPPPPRRLSIVRLVRSLPWLVAGAALCLVPLAAPSCSAGGDGNGSGGSAGSGGIGLELDGGNGASGAAFDKDAACALASDEATEVPVNLLIMFD